MQEAKLDFQKVYDEYHSKIRRYLERLTDDKQEAEDLTQEVFINVGNGLEKFEGKSSLSTWIYKIATNVASSRFRKASFKKGKKPSHAGDFRDMDKEDRSVWTGRKEPLADERIAKEEMESCIRNYVDDLPENYNAVLVLSEYEGLKNEEIAQILGLSLDNVKIRIHRARTKLKKRMEKGCDISPDEESTLFCDEK